MAAEFAAIKECVFLGNRPVERLGNLCQTTTDNLSNRRLSVTHQSVAVDA